MTIAFIPSIVDATRKWRLIYVYTDKQLLVYEQLEYFCLVWRLIWFLADACQNADDCYKHLNKKHGVQNSKERM